MPNKKKTRHGSGEAAKAVGGAAGLPQTELPLLKEIFARILQIKDTALQISNKDLIDQMYGEIIGIHWKVNSNLTLISEKRGKEKLMILYKKQKNLIRSGAPARHQRMIEFQSKLDRIFDLLACKCEIKSCENVSCEGCVNGAHISCSCKKDQKIPVKELSFVLDHRDRVGEKGKLKLGSLDIDEMERMDKNLLTKSKSSGVGVTVTSPSCQDDDNDSTEDNQRDQDYQLEEIEPEPKTVSQNRMKLRNAAKECVRWNVSPRGGAAIISAALADYGIVTAKDTSLVVDKNKLKR